MAITLSPTHSECRCIAICGNDTIVRNDNRPLNFNDLETLGNHADAPMLFEEKHMDICVLGMKECTTLPSPYGRTTLRSYFATHKEDEAFPYFRAKALHNWLEKTRFCPCCGQPLMPGTHEEEASLTCTRCGNTLFPRIEPCVIILVSRGSDILLARHRQRNSQYFSCLAGFMEAGESAEQAVRREIMEETGISVRDIRYYGSQSWPFPSQLMLAFTAEYESGEIHVQESELYSAEWFPRNQCPATPPEGSLAYRLIHRK